MLSMNERRIIDTVRKNNSISRAEAAKALGLNAATLTRLCRNLEGLSLITETIRREGQRGQPSRSLALNPTGAYAIGIDFSYTTLQIGLINLAGDLVDVTQTALPKPAPSQISKIASKYINRIHKKYEFDENKILGVGVSIPGYFAEPWPHVAAHPYFSDLLSINIEKELTDGIGRQTFIENDANCAALGEKLSGAGKDLNDFIFVYLGHGVGAGIVMDGELIRGAYGNAGGLGALFPQHKPRPSGEDLINTLRSAKYQLTDFSDIGTIDINENKQLRKWIKRSAEQLSTALYPVIRLLDPKTIVIGGRIPINISEALAEGLSTKSFTPAHYTAELPQANIVPSSSGTKATIIGAGSVPIFKALLPQRLNKRPL